jgi:radical SAM-linked protein
MPNHRLLFSKLDTARYISHLDSMRTFQRAFLRAGIPIRHTEGFNPHAFVSIALPLSVGFSSQCEILEFGLLEGMEAQEVPAKLNRALPSGIKVLACYEGLRPIKELAYVNYIVTMEYESGVPVGAENAFRALLDQDSLVVTKRSKKAKSGFTQVDIIPHIQRLSFETRRDTITMDGILAAQNPGLNPELLVKALGEAYPQFAPDFVTYHRKEVLDGTCRPFR